MAVAVQSRRGTTAQHSSFTGLAGEMTVDTDENRAVVHDGSTAGGIPAAKENEILAQGKHTIWLPAPFWTAAATNGAASATIDDTVLTSNLHNIPVFDFATDADDYIHGQLALPKSYNLGTVTFQVWWTTVGAVTTGIAFGLQAVAISDNVAIDTAFGTAVLVTDNAQSTAYELLVTAESGAVTIGNTPADDDAVLLRGFRDVSDANDDMTQDMRFIGMKLFITLDASTDT